MVFSAYFSFGRTSPRAGAHLSVTVDQASGDVESIAILSPLVDAELTAVIEEVLKAVDGHTEAARTKLIEGALEMAKGEVGIGGRITGKAGRFAAEARAVVPRESFSGEFGAVAVVVDGALAFQSCSVDVVRSASVPHETLLRQALEARAQATGHALARWRETALGALEEHDEPRALPPSSAPTEKAH
jgi:hypothetical protein